MTVDYDDWHYRNEIEFYFFSGHGMVTFKKIENEEELGGEKQFRNGTAPKVDAFDAFSFLSVEKEQ